MDLPSTTDTAGTYRAQHTADSSTKSFANSSRRYYSPLLTVATGHSFPTATRPLPHALRARGHYNGICYSGWLPDADNKRTRRGSSSSRTRCVHRSGTSRCWSPSTKSDDDNGARSACSASSTRRRSARCGRTQASTPTSDLPGQELHVMNDTIALSWKGRTRARICRSQPQQLCILVDWPRRSRTTFDSTWNLGRSTSRRSALPWPRSATSSPCSGAARAAALETRQE